MDPVVKSSLFALSPLVVLPGFSPSTGTVWAQVPNYQTVGKSCSRCGQSVPLSSQVGGLCPHCGAFWGAQTQQFIGGSGFGGLPSLGPDALDFLHPVSTATSRSAGETERAPKGTAMEQGGRIDEEHKRPRHRSTRPPRRVYARNVVYFWNRNAFSMKVELRSGDGARSKRNFILPGGACSLYVVDGNYDLFFRPAKATHTLYHGDHSLTLKGGDTAQVELPWAGNSDVVVRSMR